MELEEDKTDADNDDDEKRTAAQEELGGDEKNTGAHEVGTRDVPCSSSSSSAPKPRDGMFVRLECKNDRYVAALPHPLCLVPMA